MRRPKKLVHSGLETHLTNGHECYLDSCRWSERGLVRVTPEETVRQRVLRLLIDGLHYPETLISTEVSLHRRGQAGRADIVVFKHGSHREASALMVIECKAGPLDELLDAAQVRAYAATLGAALAFVTNAEQWITSAGERLKEAGPPTWRQVQKEHAVKVVARKPWKRPAHRAFSTEEGARRTLEKQAPEGLEYGVLGDDSRGPWLSSVAELFGLLADETVAPELPLSVQGVTIERDLGWRHRRFTNPGAYSWAGHYRCFLVSWRRPSDSTNAQDSAIVSISIIGRGQGDAGSGNENDRRITQLVVAVDRCEGDTSKTRIALQLRLDDFHRVEGRSLHVFHDGRRSRRKARDVVGQVAKHAPDLCSGGRIELGAIPARARITWSRATSLIANVIRYSLLRHEMGPAPAAKVGKGSRKRSGVKARKVASLGIRRKDGFLLFVRADGVYTAPDVQDAKIQRNRLRRLIRLDLAGVDPAYDPQRWLYFVDDDGDLAAALRTAL